MRKYVFQLRIADTLRRFVKVSKVLKFIVKIRSAEWSWVYNPYLLTPSKNVHERVVAQPSSGYDSIYTGYGFCRRRNLDNY